jgi:hypothetical protein
MTLISSRLLNSQSGLLLAEPFTEAALTRFESPKRAEQYPSNELLEIGSEKWENGSELNSNIYYFYPHHSCTTMVTKNRLHDNCAQRNLVHTHEPWQSLCMQIPVGPNTSIRQTEQMQTEIKVFT